MQSCVFNTGVPTRSVRRILAEKQSSFLGAFKSPIKRYKQSRERIFVDDFDRDAIRRKIHRMYEDKQHLTLAIIRQALRTDGLFFGGKTSLSKLLKEMGFSYKKINNKR